MMSFIHKSIAVVAVLSSIATAAPLVAPFKSRQAATAGSCVNGMTRVYMPQLYNVYYYPEIPAFPAKASTINIFNEGKQGGSAQDQIAQWVNLPAGIQNCTVGWSQAAERAFSVFDNGLIEFQQLSGIPDTVTSATVPAYEKEGAKRGAMDFTFWPQTTGKADHIGGPVDCGASVVVRMFKDMSSSGGKGSITLEQSAENGFWLQHSC